MAGQRRREEDFDRWVELDLAYIDRWSLWLDFKIIAADDPGHVPGPVRPPESGLRVPTLVPEDLDRECRHLMQVEVERVRASGLAPGHEDGIGRPENDLADR